MTDGAAGEAAEAAGGADGRGAADPRRGSRAGHGTDEDRRARLVDAAADHVAVHGIAELSLRGLGAAIGVSHRMLIHYFGSKERLFAEIVRTSEQRQRALLARSRPAPGLPPAEVARRLWRRLADPSAAGQERLFFELCGHALRGRAEAAAFAEGFVADWLEPLAAAETAAGADPATARARARLGLATVRGLLLDLLVTGDRAAVDAAMEEFLRLYYGPE
ncbi:TetR/AcrR family transcriptional regulator [Streptomyces andamanensis]|uniref:TetR/AcrR family transcriptional regulator n=1 Tax=Streptomyces andamanensis TaxID=1565035 RepID=A0ABV8TKK5_9ACTN|nr:TetR/AcrR family transcriptional regulator [Streptomyces sp. PsTaAH-124]